VVVVSEEQVVRSSDELKRLQAMDQMSELELDEEFSVNGNYRDWVNASTTFKNLKIDNRPLVKEIMLAQKMIGLGATFAEMDSAARLCAVNKATSQFVKRKFKVPSSVAKSRELDTIFLREYCILFVYGLVGSGKSATAHRIVDKYALGGNVWMYNCPRRKRHLFPDWYNHFDDLEQMSRLPPGSIIIWDDATKDAWARDFSKKFNNLLGKFLTLVRQHKLKLIIVIHQFRLFDDTLFSSVPVHIYQKVTKGDLEKLLEERDARVRILTSGYAMVMDFHRKTEIPLQELGVLYDAVYEDQVLIYNTKCSWYGDAQSCFQATNESTKELKECDMDEAAY